METLFTTSSQLPTPVNTDYEITENNRQLLSKKIVQAIDDWALAEYADPFRWHLGASIIGRKCDRYLYGVFHWWKASAHDGRKLRLFQRGKDEEKKFNQYLRGIGCTVDEVDPATGKQWLVSFNNGHFGGSSDGLLTLPESWGIPGYFLPEYKTSGTGASFNNLSKEGGIARNKEDHFIQQSIYGYGRNVKYGVYLAVNKNDDSLCCEVTELSFEKAEHYIRRAENIITTDFIPAMMPGAKETYFECKMCDFHGICHNNELLDKNCRSCVFSSPVENAEWKCSKYDMIIPREFVYQGCGDYKAMK